jgi:hypothetical protein
MSFKFSTPTLLLVAFAVSLFGHTGCVEPPQTRAANNNELKQLGSEFMDFYRVRRRTPESEEEFKAFIQTNLSPVKKELLGITDPEKMFVSLRDNKPFVVRYGATLSMSPGGGSGETDGNDLAGDIVIYEAEGKGGTRQVYTSLGQLGEIPVDELKRRVPDAQ